MPQTIRCKQRSKSRAATGKGKASRMAEIFLARVLRNDAKRVARAEMREYDREVNKVRSHHTSDRTITVFRRE